MEAGTLRFWLGLALVLGLLEAGSTLAFLENRESGTHAARIGLPLDDAWIHQTYARSLALHTAVDTGEAASGRAGVLVAGVVVMENKERRAPARREACLNRTEQEFGARKFETSRSAPSPRPSPPRRGRG